MPQNTHTMATPIARSSGVSKKTFVITIILVAIIAFICGTRGNELTARLAPLVGIKASSDTLDLSSVQATYQRLKANYDGSLDAKALIAGANRGMVAGAGDDYTVYMDQKETEEFNKDLSGDIGGGVGAEIGVRSGEPTIVRVLPNNPAEKAGLKTGDVVVAVNGKSMQGKLAADVANSIRGEVGTSVRVSVQRAGEVKEYSITREQVTNPSVRYEIKDGVGILTLSRFDGETSKLTRAAAREFVNQKVSRVVLDLRGNGGGYLSAAQDVAGLWLDDKVVVTERTGGKVVDELKSGGSPLLAGIPTVVLVDGGSASASEIVAGALKDHHAATLVGTKTFGKGTVQQIFELNGGASLKVTIARWFTPSGKNITKEGIEPNKKVELTAKDADAGKDPQMTEALRIKL